MRFDYALLVIQCFLFTFCFADVDSEQKEKFLNGFLDFLNNLPNPQYNYEGFSINAQKINDDRNCYFIETNLKAIDVANVETYKYVKCSATIQDVGESVNVQNNEYICIDNYDVQKNDRNFEEVVDDQTTISPIVIAHEPVHLHNEVQPNPDVTSGEQFIAVPRKQTGGACVGCSSHVNPDAPGVSDLAALAIRHLDKHEPNVKHFVENVHDVERQVQVVNGVRYILTLQVKFNKCSSEDSTCMESKTCKISILEKSWIKLPDGSKYRAILANNCTEEWQFGDEGEFISSNDANNENNDVNLPSSDNDNVNVLPQPTPDYDKIANTGSADEILKAIHNIDIQAIPQQEKSLTEEDVKNIEQQIIPDNKYYETVSEAQSPLEENSIHVYPINIKVHQISESEAVKHNSDSPIQHKPVKYEGKTSYVSEDKRKAIDDLINFFNSAGFDNNHSFRRTRRTYENDLHVMSLAEKVHKIKRNIQNAQHLYILAQKLVDYLNENNIDARNRVLQDVIAAEEEFENLRRFFYIQMRVVIPCDNGKCLDKDVLTNICNGIIEAGNEEKPQVLSAFCYKEMKKNPQVGKVENIPTNDPVLLKLSKEALKKIESELLNTNAMTIDQILQANTRIASGRLTNISLRLVYVNCSKTVPYIKRINCTVLRNMDANVCEVIVLERHWLKEKTISYKCTPYLTGDKFVKTGELYDSQLSVKDPRVLEMIDEALQHLDFKSNRNNRQKLNKINSIKTHLVGGLLTEINFEVAYTKCSYEDNSDLSTCELLENEPMRNCKADVWDRPWLVDGRRIKVSCNIIKENIQQTKRTSSDIVGGPITRDPKNPEYFSLARGSLHDFVKKNYISEEYEVINVEKVTVQSVAGTLTRITFKIRSKNGNVVEILCHSTIWQRPWLSSIEYSTTCDDNLKSVHKRAIPGDVSEQDPNKPQFKELANKSLQKYLESSGIKRHHKLIEVLSATVQVVAGELIELKFKVSPTNCDLDGILTNCDIIDNSDVLLCNSKIHKQTWFQKEDIQITCEKENTDSGVQRHIPGGFVDHNPNEPKYQLMAQTSLKKYLQSKKSTRHHEILQIQSASSQVVAGINTLLRFIITPTTCLLDSNMEPTSRNCVILDNNNLIYCNAQIWTQPWANTEESTVKCNHNGLNSTAFKDNMQHNRQRRSLKGSPTKENPNNVEFKNFAEKSFRKYLKRANLKFSYSIKVHRVTSQLVSGKIYKIDYAAIPKSCSLKTSPECNEGLKHYCHTEILSRPWREGYKIDVHCDRVINSDEVNINDRRKRDIFLGAPAVENVNDEYKMLAEESLTKYQQLSNAKNVHRVINIHNITTQVIAGTLTKLDFSASPTKCLIGDNSKPKADCTLLEPENRLHCQAEIWEKSWLKFKKITVNCMKEDNKNEKENEGEERVKRYVVQSEDDYIDEDTKYYYADRAVQYINDKSDTNNLQKLISVHAFQNNINMGVNMVKMYIETAYTYCLRHQDEADISNCEELTGMYHRLCYVRLWPSPDDDLVVDSLVIVCDDEKDFKSITGLSIKELLQKSLDKLEASPLQKNKLIALGEKSMIPSFDSKTPIKLTFIVSTTNCSKQGDLHQSPNLCFVDTAKLSKSCTSYIWMMKNNKKIKKVSVTCGQQQQFRSKRSISLYQNMTDATSEEKKYIQDLVNESLQKLEMTSHLNNKQRVLQINSYNSKITSRKLIVIDFDVGYTNCLKYEWVDNTKCEFMEHLPKRHCTSHITERLWSTHGRKIEVDCHDIESPLEAHIEFDNPEKASYLANEALKHIEAKYIHPFKQKIVRVLSIEKQEIAGLHYRMKVEVGFTDCYALTARDDCKISKSSENKLCTVNIWLRTWTDLPPLYRVSCDHQETVTEHHRDLQAGYLFADFLATYKPDYVDDHEEMRNRYNIFKENLKKIHELNTHERGTATYAVTRFSDLTYEEFGEKYLGLKPSLRNDNDIPMNKGAIPQVELPDTFDWRHYNAVTEVKDQGSCGSCWAFSVTGNIEGQWKIKTGNLVSLSEQELVDCDKVDDGCNGGLPDNAYRAIEQLGGLETETDYPYEGESDKCSFNKTLSKVQVTGAVNITSNETDMAKWLVKNGPISIGINANAMQFYVGGVSHPWKVLCSPKNLDHGVLIVGYGVKDYPLFHKHLPYWIVKNSWGKSWGEQGYYRVYRGDGTCGVNQMASSSVI